MGVRDATLSIPLMVDLAAVKRDQYQEYSPVFWRPAARAREAHRSFFEKHIVSGKSICLVHDADDVLNGFIIGNVISAPPIYNPGGKVCMIDDFVVADPLLWSTVGTALREETERRAAMAGAVLLVIVCAQRDEAKRRVLRESGSHVASEWYVRAIKHRTR